MEVIPNFIEDKSIQDSIKNLLFGSSFDYYYLPNTVDGAEDYFFSHILYDAKIEQYSSHFQSILMPLLGRLKFNYLMRAKVNCYPKRNENNKGNFHLDAHEPHMVGLYSVNSNNGHTLFEDGTKIESGENQMVIFDGSMKHCSVVQSDTNIRVNVNINFK